MGELFKIGQHAFVGATKNVDSLMRSDPEFKDFVESSLGKYIHNDWGDTCKDEAKMNDEAVKSGEYRILAVYKRSIAGHEDQIIWIITEWDHSVTTVLFPSEY